MFLVVHATVVLASAYSIATLNSMQISCSVTLFINALLREETSARHIVTLLRLLFLSMPGLSFRRIISSNLARA